MCVSVTTRVLQRAAELTANDWTTGWVPVYASIYNRSSTSAHSTSAAAPVSTTLHDLNNFQDFPWHERLRKWENFSTFRDFPGSRECCRYRIRSWPVPFRRFFGQCGLQWFKLQRQLFTLLCWRQMSKVLARRLRLQVITLISVTLSTRLRKSQQQCSHDNCYITYNSDK